MQHQLLTITIFIFLRSVSTLEYLPFTPGIPRDQIINIDILRRADSKCGTPCAEMGADVCCGKKASCALDQAGNVACCPHGAACTGTIKAPNGVDITPSAAGGEISTDGRAPSAAAPTAAPSAAISHAISGTSTIANSYYPFPVAPTSFTDAGECSETFSGCQAESAKCTGFVEGGGYGVTIAGAGGGVTQQGAMEPKSAEAICSSLSSQACHGLELGMCSTLGGSAMPSASDDGFVAGGSSNAAAVPTNCMGLYGIGVGLAVGIAGQVIG